MTALKLHHVEIRAAIKGQAANRNRVAFAKVHHQRVIASRASDGQLPNARHALQDDTVIAICAVNSNQWKRALAE